ncbi:MAG: Sec-independent protein translocase protein TatB [Hyphomicrobiales bacterium]
MFDIGAIELMVIAVVAIIVVGPKDLPGMLRSFGQFVGNMRKMAREFQDTFEEAAKDTGIDEITKGVSDVKNFTVTKDIGKVFDPISEEVQSVKSEIDKAGDKPSAASDSVNTAEASAAPKANGATKAKPSPAKKKPSSGASKTKAKTAAKKPATKKSAPKKQASKEPAEKTKPRSAKASAQSSS